MTSKWTPKTSQKSNFFENGAHARNPIIYCIKHTFSTLRGIKNIPKNISKNMFCKEAYKKHRKIDIFSKSLQNGTQGGSQREGGGCPTNQVFRVCFSNGAQDGPKSAPRVPKTPKTSIFNRFGKDFCMNFRCSNQTSGTRNFLPTLRINVYFGPRAQ